MRTCSKCGVEYDGAEMFCPTDGTRLAGTGEARLPSIAPDHDPMIGQVIQGRYKIISKLGEGGMGVVYTAEHVEIGKRVALKFLRDDFSKRPEVVERFRLEARAASRIGHAHIVDVTDFGEMKGKGVFFAMEYLEGQSLSDLISEGLVPVERAVPIVLQIARALAAAHNKNIVHRDLKPENVFLVSRDEQEDFVKILDFGIAKISDRDSEGERLTKTGMIFGTPEYMSPEQAAGKQLDHRVDVYALGCIMFEMFTGSVPYDGESFMAVLTQHMFEPVPALEEINQNACVPEAISAVIYKAMEKEPDNRYDDMGDLAQDLGRAMTDCGYEVGYPGRMTSDRMSRGSLTTPKSINPNTDNIPTQMEVAPPSGAFKEPKKNNMTIIAVVAICIIAGLIGSIFFVLKEKPAQDVTAGLPGANTQAEIPKATSNEEEELTAANTSTVEAVVEEDKVEPDEAKPDEEKIEVIISTQPAAAVITIIGYGQVCTETPCNVQLVAGESVEIQAKAGKITRKKNFTPSENNKEISMNLKRQFSGRKPGGSKPKPDGESKPKPGAESGTSDELKIPDVFNQ